MAVAKKTESAGRVIRLGVPIGSRTVDLGTLRGLFAAVQGQMMQEQRRVVPQAEVLQVVLEYWREKHKV